MEQEKWTKDAEIIYEYLKIDPSKWEAMNHFLSGLVLRGIQQGKREAWEEIGKMVEENNNQTYQLHEVLAALRWNVKAKLSSLDNSSKE